MKKIFWLFIFSVFFLSLSAQPQEPQKEGYIFTDIIDLPTTSVKNQYRSGTCWSFAGLSYLEDELLRTGKGEYDLSEMWIVRHTYYDKAIKHVRLHGKNEFSAGGASHDVTDVIAKYGIVPEEAYPGLGYGHTMHDHSELDAVLAGYVKGVVANKGQKLTTAWQAGLNGILDAYLGPIPESFTYNGKTYNAQTFWQSLGLNLDDYIAITSFSHHPFYTQFAIEVPDNWTNGLSWNVPLDELMRTIEYALENGYTVNWSSDVSEKGFNYMKGIAIVPEADVDSMDGTEQARWVAMSPREREAALHKFEGPGREKTITQEMRQHAYDIYETTDDHGMVITGIATDQAGNKYFKVKNSWGTDQVYGGFFYASYPFVAYKTMDITVHKNAIPADIAKKLGIK